MKILGEVWVQDNNSKDVYCIDGSDFTIDEHDIGEDTQDYSITYDTGDFKIEYFIQERPLGVINYSSNTPDTENCRIIKDSIKFSVE